MTDGSGGPDVKDERVPKDERQAKDSKASTLPDGYVERAVAEIVATAGARRSIPHIPFRSCPGCGERLTDPASFVQEYWVGNETRFMVWCRTCRETFTVVPVVRYEGTEAVD